MTPFNLKDAQKIKKTIVETSTRGFGYFIKNVALILLVLGAVFLVTHPEILTDPTEFFNEISINSLWTFVILFIMFGGIYQLSISISRENKKEEFDRLNEHDRLKAEYDSKKHAEMVMYRVGISQQISGILKDAIIDTGAQRACVFEMHNGTNNLSGMPFIFADLNYEEVGFDADYVSDEFKGFNLTKYPFLSTAFCDGYFVGSVADVENIDRRLARKLRVCNTDYLAGMLIYGRLTPIGFITVSFPSKSNHPSREELITHLSQAAQKISVLLDKSED
jgi:hypothetical protein